jgi:Glycosyl transferase family 2
VKNEKCVTHRLHRFYFSLLTTLVLAVVQLFTISFSLFIYPMPTISIALCTYNGETYLKEQLLSIAAQTILPQEVVICDDGSTDFTEVIVHEFSGTAPFDIRFIQNNPNLGTTRNFEKAISLCSGDIVFLADQDDYWQPTKIEEEVRFLMNNPQYDVVFTDALLVNQHLKPLTRTLWEEVRFRNKEKELWLKNGGALDVLIQGNRVTGCTVAFRKAFVETIMPFPLDLIHRDFIHDTWIALMAAIQDKIGFLDKPLVWYRQHDKQQIGAEQKNRPAPTTFKQRLTRPYTEKIAPLAYQQAYFDGLLKMITHILPISDARLQPIKRAIAHYKCRATLPENRLKRILPIIQNILKGNYHHFVDAEARWYATWRTIIGDLLE